ncbi:unnamed protein product [Peniophora sp. CBMAI 1063]|nr:unnamed protein product [Peniophora sp. CBMAI 1063]
MARLPTSRAPRITRTLAISPRKRLDQLRLETRQAEFALKVASHAIGLHIATKPLPDDSEFLICDAWRRIWRSYTCPARSGIPCFPSDEVIASIKVDIKAHYSALFDIAELLLPVHFDFRASSSRNSVSHNSALASRLLETHRYAHTINSDTAALKKFQHDILPEFIEQAWFFTALPAALRDDDSLVATRVPPYFKEDAFRQIPHEAIALALTVIDLSIATEYLGADGKPIDILLSDKGRDLYESNWKELKTWETESALAHELPNFTSVRATWFLTIATKFNEL